MGFTWLEIDACVGFHSAWSGQRDWHTAAAPQKRIYPSLVAVSLPGPAARSSALKVEFAPHPFYIWLRCFRPCILSLYRFLESGIEGCCWSPDGAPNWNEGPHCQTGFLSSICIGQTLGEEAKSGSKQLHYILGTERAWGSIVAFNLARKDLVCLATIESPG